MDPTTKVKEEKPSASQHHHSYQLQQQLQTLRHQQQQGQQQQQQQQQQHFQIQHIPRQQLQALLSLQNKSATAGGSSERHASPSVASASTTGSTAAQSDNSFLIEELAELISESISADMTTPPSSVAPTNISSNSSKSSSSSSNKADKCASVAQLIKTENNSNSQSSNAVQQSHVSSSKPSFVPNDLLGSILLKALNGFLFVVNSQGKVEFISENVTQFLRYTQEELVGRSIYNIIHLGDHPQFSNSLLPMTLTSGLAWPSDAPTSRGCNFHCRMHVKPPIEEEEDVEVKQNYINQYENMQITAILQSSLAQKLNDSQLNSPHSREDQTCLLCIARRLPLNEKNNMMIGGVNQFSTKQDLNGKVIKAETGHGIVISEGANMADFCHISDIEQFKKHSQEVLKNGHNTSGVYRFKVAEGRYVVVQTKSKLFNNHVTGEPEFIISTHSIIRECEPEIDLKGSTAASFVKSQISQLGNRSSSSLSLTTPSSNLAPSLSLPMTSMSLSGGMGMAEPTNADLDALAEWDLFNNLPSESLDIKPMVSDCATSPGNSNWGSIPSMKSPASTSVPSPLQFALQSSVGSNPGSIKRPPMLSMSQRSSSVTSFDVTQKNPRFTPSPGSGPRSAGFNNRIMGGYANQRSPASLAVGTGPNLQQNRNQGGQFSMGFQQKTSVSPLMSPQSGYPTSPAGWGRSPASVPPTPPSNSDFTQSLNTPLGVSLPSPLHVLSSQDSVPQSGMDINASRPVSSGFSQSFLSTPSPSYSASMEPNGHQQQGMISLGGSNNNTGVSSQRLCQLLTQNTAPEHLHSPASVDGRRPTINRAHQVSGQIGSTILTPNPVSSTNNSLTSSSGGMASLGMDLHRPGSNNSAMKSPDDHLHQSPTEGPGQSPPQKPQSTSEDGEMEITNVTEIGSSNSISHNIRSIGGVGGNSLSSSTVVGGNYILKTLLSQDDEDEASMLEPSMSSPPVSSAGHGGGASDFRGIGEKNEAEPRKPNALLKQLLGDQARQEHRELNERLRREIEHATKTSAYPKPPSSASSSSMPTSGQAAAAAGSTNKRKLSSGQELLHQLLDESDDESINSGNITTSAPAESTSTELDPDHSSRSRHQSEPQEPQSTSAPASHSEPSTLQGQVAQKRINSMNDNLRQGGRHLDELLHTLWSKDDFSPNHQQHQLPSSSSNSSSGGGGASSNSGINKRPKISLPDVDSSDGVGMDIEPSTSSAAGNSQQQQSELSQRNALLAQLLSKKHQKETVVNTNISINPTGIPQHRYPKNLSDKIIQVKPFGSGENINTGKDSSVQIVDNHGSMLHGNVSNGGLVQNLAIPNNTNINNNSNMPNFLNSGFSNAQPSLDTDSSINDMDLVQTDSQFSQFQSLLDNEVALFGSESLVSGSIPGLGHSDSTENDPLLQQILQQAEDLQDDIQKKMRGNSAVNQTPPMGISPSGMGNVMNAGGGLNINTNMNSVSSIAQALSSSLQPMMQSRLNPLQQQQQQQQQERLRLLSSQKMLHQQLLQQKQQLQQKSQDNLLSLPPPQQQQQPFLSPSQQQQPSTTSIPQSSLAATSLSSLSVSSSSQQNMNMQQQQQQQQQSLMAEMDLDDESNLVAQLEEIFKETGNWPNLDNFIPTATQSSRQDQSNEQQVIDVIKRQLMGEDPLISPPQQQQMISSMMDNGSMVSRQNLQRSLQQQLQGVVAAQQQQQQLSQMSMAPVQNMVGYSATGQGLRQGMEGTFSPGMPALRPQQQQQQQQRQQQQQQPQQSLQQQQPGFAPPRGPLATALQSGVSQLRPAGLNSPGMMVRQNLLHQQRHRQDRERQQRLLQLQQQQQHIQGLSQPFSQRFSQTGIPTIDSTSSTQAPFPDNLRELMTQGHPPNVTLPVQRGHGMPGPMSPRFSGPSPQASQLSPHFSPQPGSGGTWGMRPQGPADPMGMQQGNQFSPNLNRQRSLSGNSLPSPGNQQQPSQQQQQQAQFQFTDGSQFGGSSVSGAAGGAGLFSPSQQQQPQQGQGGQGLFPQARLMQRLPTGRGSPRAPHSPFGTSPTDPLLISPQSVMSPNSGMRQQQQGGIQLSPQYSQVPQSSSYGGQVVNLPGGSGPFQGGPSVQQGVPNFSPGGNMSQPTANALHEFDLQFFDSTISSLEGKNLSNELGISSTGPSTSQYVKQELRNICSARSEKQHQQQQQSQMQNLDFESSTSELPPDILETITDMSKEHGGPLCMDEAEVLSQSRLEARQRYEQFKRLSATGQPVPPVSDPAEEAGVKATSLFRNQLLRPVLGTPSPVSSTMKQMPQPATVKSGESVAQINILQSESRTPVDDIRPADNRNSLLCQLLSE